MNCVTEDKGMTVTPSLTGPGAEPTAMLLQPLLKEDALAPGTTTVSDGSAFSERLRKMDQDWRDPFYSGDGNNRDETVLASFDIDRDGVQNEIKSQLATVMTVIMRMLLAVILLCVLPFFWAYWEIDTFLAPVMFLVLFCIADAVFPSCDVTFINSQKPTKRMLMAQRRHVAIGRDGIYLDDADENNRHLARRRIIPFGAIATCHIKEVGFYRPCYIVVITTVPTPTDNGTKSTSHQRRDVSGGNDELQAQYGIHGLCKVQAFVDVVHMAVAMKAQSHTTRTASDVV